MENPNIVVGQPHTKDSVNYRQYESCGTCANFDGRIRCKQVQGNISSSAVCNLWTLKEANPTYTGKAFIEEEYKKSKGGS